MLVEIDCDEFIENGIKRQPIRFHEGLNTIIGKDSGGNSIGKSTLLMILDFVFGGRDYVEKLYVVQDKIKDHTIRFQFVFNEQHYYFLRSTSNYKFVQECDNTYKPLNSKPLSLENYTEFLSQKYGIDSSYGKFRQIVSRFFRIYNRPYMNERRPLNLAQEHDEEAVKAFLSIFGLKKDLEPYENAKDEACENYDYLKKASNHGDKPTIKGKEEEKQLELRLSNIKAELASIDEGLLTTDSIQLEGMSAIDSQLSKLIYQRSKINSKLKSLDPATGNDVAFDPNFDSLLEFFPNVNIKRIQEIEHFHNDIRKILNTQINEERTKLEAQLHIINSEIEKKKKERTALQGDLRITSVATLSKMNNATNLTYEKESIDKQFENTKALKEAGETKKEYEEQLKNRRKYLSDGILKDINEEMGEMNADVTKLHPTTAPHISLTENGKNYIFKTANDQGKGSQYKGMVIFDLTMLKKTILPVLIHDSDLLQPVANNPVDGIAKQYSLAEKQIFVAVDKLTSYNPETQEIFKKNSVIELYPGGGELFGRALNEPETTN